MLLYLRLAWRNMWRHSRRTLIIVLAMGLTLAMMMFYDGLIAGFNQAIYGNAVRVLGGNIQVHAPGYQAQAEQTPLLPLADPQKVVATALAQPQVVAATQRINTGGLITSREGAFAVAIVGIEPEKEQAVNLAAQHVTSGRYLTSSDEDQILIGKGLADALAVQVGDRLTLAGRATHQQIRTRTMTVVGIYDLGMPDVEKQQIYISLAEAQNLYDLTGQSTEVAIVLKNIGPEDAVIAAMKPALPGYEIVSYATSFPELASAINTKNGVMDIFSIVIVAIAGIGILNLLLMAVFERTREIGLLGALGLRPGQISFLFILEGTMIGIVGAVAGIVLGLVLNGVMGRVGLDFSAFAGASPYMALITGRIYTTWGVENLWWRVLIQLGIAAVFALFPAWEAAQHEPAQALHFV